MVSHAFALVPAVYVVLRRRHHDRRQVLLQFRDGTSFMDRHWASGAAGHVEAEESVFAAAVREVAEELGVGIEEEDLIPLTVAHRRYEDDQPVNQRVDFFFACDHWEGEPTIQEPAKCSAMAWHDLDDLPDPLVPHERRVLQGLASGDLPHVLATGFARP